MTTFDELKKAAEKKQKECGILAEAYSNTLTALAPANFVLVVGAALLSLIAGATILIQNALITETEAGILALVSAALTIIHSKLGCEEYQGECKKLLSFHRGIAEDYSNLELVADTDEFKKRFSELNDQLSATKKSTTALPFHWATAKAERGAK